METRRCRHTFRLPIRFPRPDPNRHPENSVPPINLTRDYRLTLEIVFCFFVVVFFLSKQTQTTTKTKKNSVWVDNWNLSLFRSNSSNSNNNSSSRVHHGCWKWRNRKLNQRRRRSASIHRRRSGGSIQRRYPRSRDTAIRPIYRLPPLLPLKKRLITKCATVAAEVLHTAPRTTTEPLFRPSFRRSSKTYV